MASFRICSKTFLLTYPQCDLAPIFFQEQFITKLEQYPIYYACFAQEEHHETSGKHIHVYVQFEKKITSTRVDFFDIAGFHPNLLKVMRTPFKAFEYVTKDNTYTEYKPEHRPERTFNQLSKKEKNEYILTHDLKELVKEGTISLYSLPQLKRSIEIYNTLNTTIIRKKKIVKWYFGEAGTGKTYTATEELLKQYGTFWKWNGSKWFDTYSGQKGVLIDDFRRKKNGLDYDILLKLLDEYPWQVEIKGGFTYWNPETIIFTCPVDSKEAWQWLDKDGEVQDWDHYEQLERRISEHREFNHKYISDGGNN